MNIPFAEFLPFATAFGAVFLTTFLRGLQNRSVAAGNKRIVFVVGGAMTALEGVVIIVIANQGMSVLPFTIAGSAFGWVTGMQFHTWLMRKRNKEMKKAKKTKRRERIEEIAEERVREILKETGVL